MATIWSFDREQLNHLATITMQSVLDSLADSGYISRDQASEIGSTHIVNITDNSDKMFTRILAKLGVSKEKTGLRPLMLKIAVDTKRYYNVENPQTEGSQND